MLSKITKNQRCLVRSFAAINAGNVNLASINPSDIHDSNPKAVGSVMVALARTDDLHSDLCDEIDEYWRKNFRKVSFSDAREVLRNLGSDDI